MVGKEIRQIKKEYKIPYGSAGAGYFIALQSMSSMPKDEELEQLASFQEFLVRTLYGNPETILNMKLPWDSGFNTYYFLNERGWSYRQATFRRSNNNFPTLDTDPPPPWDLVQLLDYVSNRAFQKEWKVWKLAHLEIFPMP